MKKYIFFRVIRSLVSIFLVTTLTYVVIFQMIPRDKIFKQDVMITKLKAEPDRLADYENNAYAKMNYLEYLDTKHLVSRAQKDGVKVDSANSQSDKQKLQQWAKKAGFKIKTYKQSKNFYATRDLPLLERLGRFYGHMFEFDHPWNVQDKNNPNMKRYLKIEKDPMVGWALVGSGTKYKYQIYFNDSFPYIHQNFFHLNLGVSYPTFSGRKVTEVIGQRQGQTQSEQLELDDGTTFNTADDIYSRQYQPKDKQDGVAADRYGDNYTYTDKSYSDPSMIGTSFKAGIFALIIQYVVAIPMAIWMARYKGKWIDKLGTGIVTVLIAIPGLAFIYAVRFVVNSLFGIPETFPTLGASALGSWIGPIVVLGLMSVPSLVVWFRRYMIDQQSSDYVKFAKAKGLNDSEIYKKHIFKNASIPIVQGIPGQIIGLIGGATMTETIFAMPGMGKMLPDAITANNNTIVIALVFVFTTISIFSILFGDILMTIVDPRIKLSSSGGK